MHVTADDSSDDGGTEGVDITQKPCRVTEVEFKGLKRTLPELIDRELDGVRGAETLAEVYGELQEAISALNQLDAFSGLNVSITETQRGEPETCRLELEFEEKTPWTVRAKTFVQGSEAGVEGRFGLRNLRGLGEKITLNMEYGSHSLKESAIEYFKPRVAGHSTNVVSLGTVQHGLLLVLLSWEERLKGLNLSLSSPDRFHVLSYDMGWNQMLDSQHRASPLVQDQLGHRLKSSILYQLLYDKRESRQASTGSALRWISELHGLVPHASVTRSFKNRLDAQVSWKFLPWSSLSFGAAAGVVFPLSRDFKTATTSLTERFYLGGVDSLKGFRPNCIGPSSDCRPKNDASSSQRARDYMGGDVMASAYASLNFFQRDLRPGNMGVYAHIFGDIGNVAPLSSFTDGSDSLKENVRQFAKQYRASIGVGIVLPTLVGNFEVNYVLPMRYGKDDSIRLGLQMSFGTDPFTA